MRRRIGGAFVGLFCVALAGCGTGEIMDPQTNPRAERYVRDGLAVEYMSSIDRFTYIGPSEHVANVLRKRNLLDEPAADGSYTFYGGVYTWVSPQGGALGWENAQGEKQDWPPDPAMDVGPTVRTSRTKYGHTTTSRVHRSGLREIKTLELKPASRAELSYTLENTTDEEITAGAWVNMAVRDDSVIAIRMREGSGLYGWDERSVGLFEQVLSEPDANGWRTVRIADCDWRGGIKVYVSGSNEIAMWREGYWLYRQNTGEYNERLRDHGEGPVAVYLHPELGIYEAELYGPLEDIPARGTVTSVEEWNLKESEEPTTERLPE